MYTSLLLIVADAFVSLTYLNAVLAFVTAFVIALLVIPVVIKVALEQQLVDQPNARKVHKQAIPTLGGIGIFIGFIVATLIWLPFYEMYVFPFLISALFILFATGIRDDLYDMSAKKKLLIQLFTAALVAFGGVKIVSLSGLFGIYELPIILQYGLTLIVIAGLTNAFNLIDGIDGLAGGVGCMNALVFGGLFCMLGEWNYAILAFALAGSLLAFLRYNFNPASIFMGDTGSLIIGFLLSVLGIHFLQVSVGTAFQANALIILFGILLLPVFDTLRVFIVRMSKKRSPFSADKKHIHHLLIKTGFNHKKSALIMYLANIILISSAFLLRNISQEIAICILMILGLFLIELLTLKRVMNAFDKLKHINDKSKVLQKENRFLTRNIR